MTEWYFVHYELGKLEAVKASFPTFNFRIHKPDGRKPEEIQVALNPHTENIHVEYQRILQFAVSIP